MGRTVARRGPDGASVGFVDLSEVRVREEA
jgi:hypothetical protein